MVHRGRGVPGAAPQRGESGEIRVRLVAPTGKPGQARAIATSTRNETASKVRKWMGTHPETGVPFVPMGTDKYYRLDGRLLDLELFRRLRERGDAKAAAGVPTAIDDYVTALNLVRGPILPEASGTGWGWLANEDRREDLESTRLRRRCRPPHRAGRPHGRRPGPGPVGREPGP